MTEPRSAHIRVPTPPGHTWHAHLDWSRLAMGTWVVEVDLRLVDDSQGLHGVCVDDLRLTIDVPTESDAAALVAQIHVGPHAGGQR